MACWVLACRHNRRLSFPSTCAVEVTARQSTWNNKRNIGRDLRDALLSGGTRAETELNHASRVGNIRDDRRHCPGVLGKDTVV